MADYSRQDLESALRNADAAGDVEAARQLANALAAMSGAPNEPEAGLETPGGADGSAAVGGYDPTLLPVKRVPEGKGMFSIGSHSYDLVVPGVLKDVWKTAIEGGEAARGHRTMEEMQAIGPEAALLAVGAPGAATVAKKAAVEVPEMAAKAGKELAAAGREIPQAVADLTRLPAKEVPKSAAKIKAIASQAYNIADTSGVRVSPEAFESFVSGLTPKLKEIGYSGTLPNQLKPTNELLADLSKTAAEGEPLRFSELDNMRQTISDGISSTAKSNRKYYRRIRDEFDDFIGKLDETHLDVGEAADLDTVRDALTTARAAWGTQAKMGGISRILEIASRQKYPDRYIEQRFTNISKNDKLFNQYTSDEQRLITKVANGGGLDVLGKWFAPSGDRVGAIKGFIGAGVGAGATGSPAGAVILPAIGMAAKKMAERSRLANVQKLQDTIALGHKPMGVVDRWRAARATRRAGIPE